jgi:hypothetical protein
MTKNSNIKWSPEEDNRLLELRAADRSFMRIAAALGRSMKAVKARFAALKRSTPSAADQSTC